MVGYDTEDKGEETPQCTRRDVFQRGGDPLEGQAIWSEFYPFADERVLEAASAQGLPNNVKRLAGLCSQADFPRLLAAVMRAERGL